MGRTKKKKTPKSVGVRPKLKLSTRFSTPSMSKTTERHRNMAASVVEPAETSGRQTQTPEIITGFTVKVKHNYYKFKL